MDRLFFILLGICAVLTGLLLVTNIRVEYGPTICGVAALALGVVCCARAAK
jgi:hypothetical protein